MAITTYLCSKPHAGCVNVNRFIFKFLVSSSIFNKDQSFRSCISSIKCIHSIHQSKPTKSIKHFYRNSKQPPKKDVPEPKVYTRDTISNIYRLLKYSTWDTAKEELSKLSIKWDSFTVNQVLKTHPPMEKAWLFFNWASGLKGLKHDQYTYTTMLDIFGEAGRIASMNYVFKQMQEKGIKIDAVTYTSMMHWVSRYGDVDGAIKIWEEMKDKGFVPTVVSYTAYMKVLFNNNRAKEASEVYKEMLESGVSPNCHTYTVLMEYLVVTGKYQEALEIFREMQETGVQPDKAACNILVERCCKVGETGTMIQILQYMKDNYLVLRYPVFQEALRTIEDAGASDALLRQVNPHCAIESINNDDALEFVTVESEDSLERGLILMLLEKKNLVAIDHLLAGLMDKNIILDSCVVSTIIEVNCDCCRIDGALAAFEYSVKMCIDLERTAYLSLIGILIRSNTFMKMVEIVEVMTRSKHCLGTYLGALLIYRLGHARRPTCAAKIFYLLPGDQKGTATYTALIGAYFSAGTAEKGLKIYKAMKKKGVYPSSGTFNVLLAGLEKSDRVSEIETYRKERKSLLSDGYCQHNVPMDVKICDLLFAGNLVP